jgi:hypothetical protein
MHARLPVDAVDQPHLRNVDIRRDGDRWLWYTPSNRTISVDITDWYAPWDLNADELQHIADGAAGRLDVPPPPPRPPPISQQAQPPLTPVIARNCILFGPPGTGKSRNLSVMLQDAEVKS